MDDHLIAFKQLVDRGIMVSLITHEDTFYVLYSIDGFYKSGTVTVDTVKMTITARYGKVTTYEHPSKLIETLVSLNYDWWMDSKDRYDGWEQPRLAWGELLVEFGLVKKVSVTKFVNV